MPVLARRRSQSASASSVIYPPTGRVCQTALNPTAGKTDTPCDALFPRGSESVPALGPARLAYMNPLVRSIMTEPSAPASGVRLWSAFACLAMFAGCSVCQQARRTVIEEPLQYSSKGDRERSLATYRLWAESAWRQERAACATFPESEGYSLGFRDGFVDYIYAGGNGEPPPVPPRKFWNVEWRSPAGHAAAADWFAGYRHGAQVARDGGHRREAVVHSSLESFGHEGPPPYANRAPPESLLNPPEDLGPPPRESEGEELRAPSEEETPQPTLPAPEEAPDESPPPPTDESERTADNSTDDPARQFTSALRSAAHRMKASSDNRLNMNRSVDQQQISTLRVAP